MVIHGLNAILQINSETRQVYVDECTKKVKLQKNTRKKYLRKVIYKDNFLNEISHNCGIQCMHEIMDESPKNLSYSKIVMYEKYIK